MDTRKRKKVKISNVELTAKELLRKVLVRLKPFDKRNYLERFAIFMGKAQIIEFSLKNLLIAKYKYKENKLEHATLGSVICELESCNFRSDFIILLKQLLKYRNTMAHSTLINHALGVKLVGEDFVRFTLKDLNHALFKVEEVIQVYDFLASNNFLEKQK